MKILVCVKQVPETDIDLQTDASTGAVRIELPAGFKMNRLDEYALEAAVRIKEAHAGTTVDVLTVGPERAAEVLKRAIGMGSDNGMLIQTGANERPDASVISSWIVDCVRDRPYDLIFTGAMSEDTMGGQTGPMIAALLDRPWTTNVVAVSGIDPPNDITVEREIEGGRREILIVELPAVLSIQSGPQPPRYPSLSNLLRANRQPIEEWPAGSLREPDDRLRVLLTTVPDRSRAARFLEGSVSDKASALFNILKENAFIR